MANTPSRVQSTGFKRRQPNDGIYPNDRSPSVQPRPAHRGILCDAHVYLLLARSRHSSLRSWLIGLLCGGHRRAGGGRSRALVHSRHHAVQLCGAGGLRRKLFDVHPRRRLPRSEGGPRRHLCQAQRFGADVRLHSHRTNLRRISRAIYYRLDERAADGCGQ